MTRPPPSIVIILPAKQVSLDCDPRGFGGIYKAALAQVQALRSVGTRVTVITASLPFCEDATREGAECHFHPHWHSSYLPILNPICWRQARRVMKQRPVAAIHHSGRSWPWAFAMLRGVAHIGVIHSGSIKRTKYFPYQFALSTKTLNWLASLPEHAKYQFRHIKNGLLETQTSTPIPVSPPVSIVENPPLRLGFLGRCCFNKGIDVLLNALALVKQRGIGVTLSIVGEESPEYRQLADALGVGDLVTFRGWTRQPEVFFRSIDVFCLASRYEPFGLVVLEAMKHGLPVISSASEGPSDIIQDGVSGLLFPSENAVELANAIETLHASPEMRRRLGEGAWQRIRHDYSPRAVGESILRAIESLPNHHAS